MTEISDVFRHGDSNLQIELALEVPEREHHGAESEQPVEQRVLRIAGPQQARAEWPWR